MMKRLQQARACVQGEYDRTSRPLSPAPLIVSHCGVNKRYASVIVSVLHKRGYIERVARGKYKPAEPIAIPVGPQDVPIPSFLRCT